MEKVELNQKRAIIFDLDDTLVNSTWMWRAIDVGYPARFDLECLEDPQREIEDMSFSETTVYLKERFNLEDSLEQVKGAWIQMSIGRYKNEVPLEPGVRAFLDYIGMNGTMADVVTSNGRAMMDAVLDSLDTRRCFKVVTAAYEVIAGKPAPDIYLSVVGRLHVKPSDCAVSEGAPTGTQADKDAGMTMFAVEGTFSRGMREEEWQLADYYIKDRYELLGRAVG